MKEATEGNDLDSSEEKKVEGQLSGKAWKGKEEVVVVGHYLKGRRMGVSVVCHQQEWRKMSVVSH